MESDEEFLNRQRRNRNKFHLQKDDLVRLFALARRGAAAGDMRAALVELYLMCLRQEDFNDDRDGLTLDRARAALEPPHDR